MKAALRRLMRWLAPKTPDYLRQQVTRSWKKESRNLQWFGLRDGMAVVDLGCGPGHFIEALAGLLPQSKLTAIDNEPAMLEHARRLLGDRVTFVQAGAEQTGLPTASFDFAIARLLFQHLADPLAVAREAHRILKPGGKLVVIDIDDGLFGVVEPALPGLRRLMARFGAAQAARGGNRRIGRSLVRLLKTAGFSNLEVESVAVHSEESGLGAVLPQLDPAPLQALVAAGRLSQQEAEELRAAHRQFLAEDPSALVLLFMVSGLKS